MRASTAQRLRFGILAARHAMERDRLTPSQIDYLEGCLDVGWIPEDSQRAYDHETWAVLHRERENN